MEQAFYENWVDKQPIAGLPVECFFLEDSSPGVFAASHWHSAAELIYVQQGGYQILVNGVSYSLGEGDSLLIHPWHIHTTICPPDVQALLGVLKFDLSLLRFAGGTPEETEFLGRLDANLPPHCFPAPVAEDCGLLGLLSRVFWELKEQKDGAALAVRLFIGEAILRLLRFSGPPEPKSAGTGFVNRFYPVFRYMEEHFAEQMTASDILPLCNLSYSRFAVLFRQFTGCTFTDYLNRYRIARAQQLLQNPEFSISQAAEHCGFLDICYFDRMFRKYVGAPPSVWRKQEEDKKRLVGTDWNIPLQNPYYKVAR